jgi:hypothetical protein
MLSREFSSGFCTYLLLFRCRLNLLLIYLFPLRFLVSFSMSLLCYVSLSPVTVKTSTAPQLLTVTQVAWL